MFLILAVISFSLLLYWYYRRKQRMTILERNGIPGPKPDLIFGNMSEYNKYGYNECFNEWRNKYGRIFGYYLGAKAFVFVTDSDLLKLIKVNDFSRFFDRPYVIPGGIYRNWKFHQQVNRVDALRWRKMRSAMSQWFSSAQLKSMVPVVQTCIQEMMRKIETKAMSDEKFNVCLLLERLTMDIIHKCAFGVDSDVQNTLNFSLLDSSQAVLSAKTSEFLASLLLCFPEFSYIINFIRDIVEKIYDFWQLENHGLQWNAVKNIVNKRIESKSKFSTQFKDMVQCMVDKHSKTSQQSHDSLNSVEIIANLIAINEAAYESPANNIAFVLHCLLSNPGIYDKVTEEIDQLFANKTVLDYEDVSNLRLTEAVIYESFRMFPTDPLFISHSPDVDYKYNEMFLPKGVDIRVPTIQLHYDSEYWPRPQQFNPNRFLNENKNAINSVAFEAFGVGPRACPGRRFAILEIKLIIANILGKYRLEACDPIKFGSLELDFKLFSISPKNGLFVRAIPRHKL